MHTRPVLRLVQATPRQRLVADKAVARFQRQQRREDRVADAALGLILAGAAIVGALLLWVATS
jgi:fatty acid desaturase